MGNINDYEDSLRIERENSEKLNSVYRKMLPNIHKIVINKDKHTQYLGIDKLLYIDGVENPLRIEEKYRTEWYHDIALEYISNSSTNNPGWMEKYTLCDYLFYAVLPKSYLIWLYWPHLKWLWELHKHEWIPYGIQEVKGFKYIVAFNKGYTTLSVGVPIELLVQELGNSIWVYKF